MEQRESERREEEARRKAETLARMGLHSAETPPKPPKPLPNPHGHARSQSAPRPPPKPETRPEMRTTRVGNFAFQVSKPGAERSERKSTANPRSASPHSAAKEPQRSSVRG